MTRDLRGKIDLAYLEALEEVDFKLRSISQEYMLVGALARDLNLLSLTGVLPQRATRDIDIAMDVDSMDAYTVATESLGEPTQTEHRFFVKGIEVDVVPFGAIQQGFTVEFSDSVLDVSGFSEAFRSSVSFRLSDSLTVKCVSLPMLLVLKILAWRDRRLHTIKDADDIRTILESVDLTDFSGDSYPDETALKLVDYDLSTVSSVLMGMEAAETVLDATADALMDIFRSSYEDLKIDLKTPLNKDRIRSFFVGFSHVRSSLQ